MGTPYRGVGSGERAPSGEWGLGAGSWEWGVRNRNVRCFALLTPLTPLTPLTRSAALRSLTLFMGSLTHSTHSLIGTIESSEYVIILQTHLTGTNVFLVITRNTHDCPITLHPRPCTILLLPSHYCPCPAASASDYFLGSGPEGDGVL